MDQETLVDAQIRDGWNLAMQFDHDGGGIGTVFWARTSEDGKWFLYLVSAVVEIDGPIVAYRLLYDALRKQPESSLQQFRIKLIGPSNPMAEDIRSHKAFQNEFKRPNGVYYLPDSRLGNEDVDAFYIYRKPQGRTPMTHDDVKKTMLDLMSRTGPRPSSVVTLQDGSTFQGIPFGIEVSENLMNAKFIDDSSHLPRVVPVDQIASIQ